ncbi:hypothetical protein EJB05_13143, partial [Eragrostis curvula]
MYMMPRIMKYCYPYVGDWDAPVPSPFPIPKCACNMTAVVTQSKHPLTAACAYFCCPRKIDGPEKYDHRILVLPWTVKKAPYESFKRWVAPPPNPPRMSKEECKAKAKERLANPPLCDCGYRSELETPPPGLKYTPFFRCPIALSGNKRGCDFQELIHRPKRHYPDPDTLPDAVLYGEELPCRYPPPLLCQCGVPAREGVVSSELGYGHYCGNTVGADDEWDTRRCDWETFKGKEEFLKEAKKRGHEYYMRALACRRGSIRHKYLTTLPSFIYNTICSELKLKRENPLFEG